ncbi:PREDICTED: odorant receptor 13a-like [Dinoponera quadriceps]|uniref:Odorant receptor 13a-like n=1 Tax=Dinoponera quadriceps TaxID=609295 RepID=A0A6P3X9L8_DINQU|nr:PREDICTED: odorant receptor 13a-like [Dinoponera quadriceps]
MYKLLPTNATYSAKFLYRLEHVCDVDKYFDLLMLHSFVSVFYIVAVPIAVDTLFILCIQHVCALFEVIHVLARFHFVCLIVLHTVFKFIMVEVQFDEIVRIAAASLAQLLHIYYLSWMCQLLLDQSSGLHEVIYSCNWYLFSMRSRQLLRFMLLRSTKLCQIKAGKMYVMSMENFSSILQVSISYFTMLTSLQ